MDQPARRQIRTDARRVVARWRVLFAALCLAPGAAAQTGLPLVLDEVLEASGTHFPQIREAIIERRVAAGEADAALGAFDVVISADSYSWATGFYDGNLVGAKATQPLRSFGADVYGQYRISTGDFPIYQDQNFTNLGGQAKVGLVFSLLRDRDIDQRRFAETDARFVLRNADIELLLTQIAVQQQAAAAYWNWVAAGRALEVYRDLLTIAEDRDVGLRKQLEQGAIAAFFVTENEQNITRRSFFVTQAERDFRRAAVALSFYLRGADGEPGTVPSDRLPPDIPVAQMSDMAVLASPEQVDDALARRPEVARLRNAIDRAMNRMALLENDLKPSLDVTVELSDGLGGIGEGGRSRDTTDATVGLSFSVPVQRRAARARLAQARNKLDAMRLEQQRVEERIALEVQGLVLSLRYAEELSSLADKEVVQSRQLADAERKRFQSGASDFFVVNLREQTVANVRVRAVAARLQTQLARINLDAATINLQRLGLSALPPLP